MLTGTETSTKILAGERSHMSRLGLAANVSRETEAVLKAQES